MLEVRLGSVEKTVFDNQGSNERNRERTVAGKLQVWRTDRGVGGRGEGKKVGSLRLLYLLKEAFRVVAELSSSLAQIHQVYKTYFQRHWERLWLGEEALMPHRDFAPV